MNFVNNYVPKADPADTKVLIETFEHKCRPYCEPHTEEFIDSLIEQFEERGFLTMKQNDKLEEIVDGMDETEDQQWG